MTVKAEVRVIPPVEPEKEVILTMPLDTAISLQSLIGGCVSGVGPVREQMDSIYYALNAKGVHSRSGRFIGFVNAAP